MREGEQFEHPIFHLGDADRVAVDGISRCTWSTLRRPPQSVAGISLPLASDASSLGRFSLSSGDTVRGLPISACWISPSRACASRPGASLLRSAGATVEHRFDLDQSCRKCLFSH
jgi:hypothetical protein